MIESNPKYREILEIEQFFYNYRIELSRKGIRQYQLAERLGVTPGRVSRILNDTDGPTNITLKTMQKLADAIGMTVNQILNPDEDTEVCKPQQSVKIEVSENKEYFPEEFTETEILRSSPVYKPAASCAAGLHFNMIDLITPAAYNEEPEMIPA